MERILHIPFGIGARFDRRTIPERLRLRAVVEGSVAVDGHHDGRSRPLIGSRLELAGSQIGLIIRRGVERQYDIRRRIDAERRQCRRSQLADRGGGTEFQRTADGKETRIVRLVGRPRIIRPVHRTIRSVLLRAERILHTSHRMADRHGQRILDRLFGIVDRSLRPLDLMRPCVIDRRPSVTCILEILIQ